MDQRRAVVDLYYREIINGDRARGRSNEEIGVVNTIAIEKFLSQGSGSVSQTVLPSARRDLGRGL